jgi:hypothetical protein
VRVARSAFVNMGVQALEGFNARDGATGGPWSVRIGGPNSQAELEQGWKAVTLEAAIAAALGAGML